MSKGWWMDSKIKSISIIQTQCWICPRCFDDHRKDDLVTCINNLEKELDKYKKAYEVILNGLKYYSQRMGMGGTGRDAIKEASKILECEE